MQLGRRLLSLIKGKSYAFHISRSPCNVVIALTALQPVSCALPGVYALSLHS